MFADCSLLLSVLKWLILGENIIGCGINYGSSFLRSYLRSFFHLFIELCGTQQCIHFHLIQDSECARTCYCRRAILILVSMLTSEDIWAKLRLGVFYVNTFYVYDHDYVYANTVVSSHSVIFGYASIRRVTLHLKLLMFDYTL